MKPFSNSYLIDPSRKEALLVLIREDLKSQKVFDHLSALGLEDTFYQSDLAEIVLKEAGLNAESEKDQFLYYQLVKEYALRITVNQHHLTSLADELLSKLLEERGKRFVIF